MKTLFTFVVVNMIGLAASAQFRTQDNVNYIITLKKRSQLESCVASICEISKRQGTGLCEVSRRFGILTTNLTSRGVNLVKDLPCEMSIRVEQTVEARPRIGRGNN